MDPPKRASNPPDFLVKLLTMVQDEATSLIHWNGGKLFIHDPLQLERRLSAYFRRAPRRRSTWNWGPRGGFGTVPKEKNLLTRSIF